LCGALQRGNILRPRTNIARERIVQSSAAMRALNSQGVIVGLTIPADERESIQQVEDWREKHPNHNWFRKR
jgi:hypothetical protein